MNYNVSLCPGIFANHHKKTNINSFFYWERHNKIHNKQLIYFSLKAYVKFIIHFYLLEELTILNTDY